MSRAILFAHYWKRPLLYRAATRGKTVKTAVLPEFCEVERGVVSGGPTAAAAVVCLSCLPKIYPGGPVLKFIEKKKN